MKNARDFLRETRGLGMNFLTGGLLWYAISPTANIFTVGG
jgi:hypothetical protein